MSDPTFKEEVALAEELDAALSESGDSIADVSDALETAGLAIASTTQVQLTDHQQERVNQFKNAQSVLRPTVYAVADKAALEGFTDVAHTVMKKAVKAFSQEVPANFLVTSKALRHYSGFAKRVRTHLAELRPLLAKRDLPINTVFEYGAYSRFFMANGSPVDNFQAFNDIVQVECIAIAHVINAIESYAIPVTGKIFEGISDLQIVKHPDNQKLVLIQDSIATLWENTWRESKLTFKPGRVPQEAINGIEDRKYMSLAPLLDNRYLIAYQPKAYAGSDRAKIIRATGNYGANVAQEKSHPGDYAKSMNLPECKTLLELVDLVLSHLNDFQGFDVLAKKSEAQARDFKKAADIIVKQTEKDNDDEYFAFMADYFKLATNINRAVQDPYAQIAWAFIRTAMAVSSMVELSVFADKNEMTSLAALSK